MVSKSILRRHIPELDGVRGCAILMVLIWHYLNCQGVTQRTFLAYSSIGSSLFYTGVDLFFVLSGFLIGGILIDYQRNRGFYRTFYMRRAARILPVYCFTLACFFVLRATLDHRYFGWLFESTLPDAAYLTFTQNIAMGLQGTFGPHFLGITWSLAVEEQFYLVVPILLLISGIDRFKFLVVLFVVLTPFLRVMMPGFHTFVNTPFRMDSLFIGVVLAIMFRSDDILDLLDRHKKALSGIFVAMLFGMAALTLTRVDLSSNFLGPTALAIFYASFIALAVLYQDSKITSVLRTTLMTRLGMYSYGLYMYHQMVAGLMHGMLRGAAPTMTTGSGILITLASLFITVGLSVISYHTFEMFFMKLGRRFHYEDGGSRKTHDMAVTMRGDECHPEGAFQEAA